jgi:hypothetical protein
MQPEIILGRLLQRFIDQKSSQFLDYNRFVFLRFDKTKVYVGRENGADTPIPFAKILRAINAYQTNPDWYDEGPVKLREAGITHITSPVHSLLHLLAKQDYTI